jgi:hypothetical protein
MDIVEKAVMEGVDAADFVRLRAENAADGGKIVVEFCFESAEKAGRFFDSIRRYNEIPF